MLRRLALGLAAILAVLAIPTAASAATTPVTSLSGAFSTSGYNCATDPSCPVDPAQAPVLAADGVHFGPFANANLGGTLFYSGANGLKLSDLTKLSYTFSYTAQNEPTNYTAAPYLRVFLTDSGGAGHDIVLDPGLCATTAVSHDEAHTYDMVGFDHLRYDDDACGGLPDYSWDQLVGSHGDEVITGIRITQGFSVGENFSATVPTMSVNGSDFQFTLTTPPPPGQTGVPGTPAAPVQNPGRNTGFGGQSAAPAGKCVSNKSLLLHRKKGARRTTVTYINGFNKRRTVRVSRKGTRISFAGREVKRGTKTTIRIHDHYKTKTKTRTLHRTLCG